MSEAEFHQLKMKYTNEGTWGEILKICRDQMTPETFEKILPDLLLFLRQGHDALTKSAAASFINDIVLEQREHLIKPQNSKKICQRVVELY